MPYDFFNAVARVSGRDLSWFWTTWFYQAWPLDQAIGSVVTAGDSVAITVVDRGIAPMPVVLAITHADGKIERTTLAVDGWFTGRRQLTAVVTRGAGVTRVEIDPDQSFPDLDRANNVWVGRVP
jgi:hypothetical protein